MAQFRTTADILDAALRKSGEVTSGTSPYETDALEYLNSVHLALISGGTIPVGKDATVQVDEVWPWSRSREPMILELQPKYTTGTLTVTVGSEAITFSTGPADSLEGWHIKIDGESEWYKIRQHTAAATGAELDSIYSDSSGSGKTFRAVKLDYDLVPTHIAVDDSNNKIQFQEVAGTTITGTISDGVYSISAYCTAVKSALDTAGGAPTYTVTYSAITRKFTIASDRSGGAVFVLVGTGDQSKFSAHKTMGFDDENTTNAASVTSTYVLGGIARLIEPMEIHKGSSGEGNIYGIDEEAFKRNHPLAQIIEGIPDRFYVYYEDEDGLMRVRFNGYPKEKTRFLVNFVPVPRDLKDSSASIPLVPRKHIHVLEDAAAFRILFDKNDDRAQVYAQLMQGKIDAMISQNRGALARTGKHFGQIVSRPDNMPRVRRNLSNYGYE